MLSLAPRIFLSPESSFVNPVTTCLFPVCASRTLFSRLMHPSTLPDHPLVFSASPIYFLFFWQILVSCPFLSPLCVCTAINAHPGPLRCLLVHSPGATHSFPSPPLLISFVPHPTTGNFVSPLPFSPLLVLLRRVHVLIPCFLPSHCPLKEWPFLRTVMPLPLSPAVCFFGAFALDCDPVPRLSFHCPSDPSSRAPRSSQFLESRLFSTPRD